MKFEVPEEKWIITEQKARSRASGVINEIYRICPSVFTELCPPRVAEHYIQNGMSIHWDDVVKFVSELYKLLEIHPNDYRTDKQGKTNVVMNYAGTYDWPSERITCVDRYYFLCYVRDLMKEDPDYVWALVAFRKL